MHNRIRGNQTQLPAARLGVRSLTMDTKKMQAAHYGMGPYTTYGVLKRANTPPLGVGTSLCG